MDASFSAHAERGTPPASRTIAVTGASGLIGGALVSRLRDAGHTVKRLVRTAAARPDELSWDPERGVLDPRGLEGVNAVVHLAGAPIARRWTEARRREIRESRVQGTALIARTLAALDAPPAVLVSGSATGYYGDRGDELLDEGSAAGSDFLAEVARAWESATAPAAAAGVRVVLARTGVVLSARGGALGKLLPIFRLGAGGPLASGRQWMSWITLEDHLRAIEHLMQHDAMRGPVNLVSPNPVTNAAFTAALGHAVHRPAVLPVPRFALELLYGEMAESTLLASQRAVPAVLASSGFEWRHPALDEALRAVLA